MSATGMIRIKVGMQTSKHNRRPLDGNTNETDDASITDCEE